MTSTLNLISYQISSIYQNCVPAGNEYLLIKDQEQDKGCSRPHKNSFEGLELDENLNETQSSLFEANNYLPLTFINLNLSARSNEKSEKDKKTNDILEIESGKLKSPIYYKKSKTRNKQEINEDSNIYLSIGNPKKENKLHKISLSKKRSFKNFILNCIGQNITQPNISDLLAIKSFTDPLRSEGRRSRSNKLLIQDQNDRIGKIFVQRNIAFMNKIRQKKRKIE